MSVLDYIKAHPGCRMREIESTTHYSKPAMIEMLNEYEKNGLIHHILYRDLANMEIYNKWYLTK